ncbi:MAG: LysR family transcriptional regulator [Microbacterium sp.]|jgi:DNA-binding transcriptional LysR family regulator|nr:LysR family transcriptional regulator [Microbacterium sp.]
MREPSPEWLITFLAVARLGRYTAAAQVLGVNHSTVSRRIAALEEAMGGHLLVGSAAGWELSPLGRRALAAAENIERELALLAEPETEGLRGLVRIAAPDAYSAIFLMPILAAVRERHPEISFEVISATRRVRQHRSGVDIEVSVGRSKVRNALSTPLHGYTLALFAAPDYLERRGAPRRIGDLAEHPVIFYVDAEMHIDELDDAFMALPSARPSIRSTGVFGHLTATSAGAGIALLPDYLAAKDPALVRVLPEAYGHRVHYWATTREESLRTPAVAETFRAILEDAGTAVGG